MKQKTKRNLLICIAVIAVILFMFLLILNSRKKENNTQYSNLRELLKKFDCTYIKQKVSSLENIKTDIYLKFGKNLYESDKSNERYFIDLIQTLAKFEEYENFRLIDMEKQIEIIGIADDKKTNLKQIFINGQNNYFGKHDSELALQKQKEQKTTKLQIVSEEINSLIQNGWKRKEVNFGSRETIYEDYFYYFDEGIKVRTIATKVYNIVFTQNYKAQVVKGITTKMTQEAVIRSLGTPDFGKNGDRVIGYKGNDIYLFHSGSEISIYPRESYDASAFINTVKNIGEETTINELIDDITSIWNDYDKYEYNLDKYICIRYSLKGVQIQFNMENNNGIVFYNNYKGNFGDGLTIENLQKDTSKIPDRFYFKNEDLVYISELERYDEDKLTHMPEGYANLRGTDEFYATVEIQNGIQKKLRVISKTRKYADSDIELDAQILSYIWIDNETLAYSVKNEGIYLYNAKRYTKKRILETTKDCNILKYENGRLYYNNTSIKI